MQYVEIVLDCWMCVGCRGFFLRERIVFLGGKETFLKRGRIFASEMFFREQFLDAFFGSKDKLSSVHPYILPLDSLSFSLT